MSLEFTVGGISPHYKLLQDKGKWKLSCYLSGLADFDVIFSGEGYRIIEDGKLGKLICFMLTYDKEDERHLSYWVIGLGGDYISSVNIRGVYLIFLEGSYPVWVLVQQIHFWNICAFVHFTFSSNPLLFDFSDIYFTRVKFVYCKLSCYSRIEFEYSGYFRG